MFGGRARFARRCPDSECMKPTAATKPRISLDMLARMLERLTPEELARFPARKLPENIPADWLKALPPEQLARMRGLLAEREAEMRSDVEHTADAVAEAMRKADTTRLPAALRILQRDVGSLADLIHKWRNNLYATVEVRSLPAGASVTHESSLPSVEEEIPTSTPLERKHDEIERLLRGLHADFLGLFQAEWVLKARIDAGGDPDGQLAAALRNLRVTIAPLEELLARYHTLRLTIAHHEMSGISEQVKASREGRVHIQRRIESLRARLQKRAGSWLRMGSDPERARIEETIADLGQQAEAFEIPIRRDQVMRWLDAYADTALNPLCRRMAQRRLDEARDMLIRLIEEFSAQAANRVRDYSGRVKPTDAAQMLRGYFGAKAGSPMLNYSAPAATLSTELLRLEKELCESLTGLHARE